MSSKFVSKNYDDKMRCKFSENMNEIEKINAMARDEGLTYGQYVAKHKLYSYKPKETVAKKEKKQAEKERAKIAKEKFEAKPVETKSNNQKKWWEVTA